MGINMTDERTWTKYVKINPEGEVCVRMEVEDGTIGAMPSHCYGCKRGDYNCKVVEEKDFNK
jgi:hypothetical protein